MLPVLKQSEMFTKVPVLLEKFHPPGRNILYHKIMSSKINSVIQLVAGVETYLVTLHVPGLLKNFLW